MGDEFKVLRGITPDMQLGDSDLRQSRITTTRFEQQKSLLPDKATGQSPGLDVKEGTKDG